MSEALLIVMDVQNENFADAFAIIHLTGNIDPIFVHRVEINGVLIDHGMESP